MNLLFKKALVLSVFFPLFCFAQTGNINGRVTDLNSKKGLPKVSIELIKGVAYAQTDSLGNFLIENIIPGKYDLVFTLSPYLTDTLKGVEVHNTKTTVINKTLSPDQVQLGEVVITDVKQTDTDIQLLLQIKNSSEITSGISSEQINRGQDKDASEAVKRIPGVSLNEDRFIVVRGLNERYNTVWINGAGIPSSEPEKKAFSFDVIQSSLIDQIIVYKTPSAELPGDFAGGMIKIFTKSAPLGQSFLFNMNGFYRDGSTFNTLNLTQGSKTDWLGFDNGFRNIPTAVPSYIEQSSVALTKSFKNTWAPHDLKALPDFRCNMSYSNGFKIKEMQLGIVAGMNYANLNTLYKIHSQEDTIPNAVNYTNIQSTNYVKAGGILNFNFLINQRNKIELKNLINQMGRNQTNERSGTDAGNNTRSYSFGYQSRLLIASQFEYSHTFKKNSRSSYDCSIGRAYNFRSDPDLRSISYQFPPDTFYRANIAPGSGIISIGDGATRSFSQLKENQYSFSQNLKLNIKLFNYSFDLNAGTYCEYKTRIFASRLFGYYLPPSYFRRELTGLPVGVMFSDQYIDMIDTSYGANAPKGFRIGENTVPSDVYHAQNLLYAGYASLDLPLIKHLRLLAGLRMEDNTQSLQSKYSADTIDINLKTRYYLPSFNLRYEISDKALLRIVYGKTLNRPEFREWSPTLYYDFDLLALSHGTLFPSSSHPKGFILKTAIIDNYDIRYELYPNNREMIHVGVFYKKFTDPIEQISESVLHRTGISQELIFQNSSSAYCLGTEIEIRKNLGFMDGRFRTKIFNDLNLIANCAFIKSQVSNKNDTLIRPRALQGQAPYLINSGLFYSNSQRKLEVSVSYNVIGPRIFLAGGTDGPGTPSGPSVGEMPRHTIDLTIREKITSHISINLGIQDILNQPVLYVEDTNRDGKFQIAKGDKEFMSYKRGSYFSFGIKIKL